MCGSDGLDDTYTDCVESGLALLIGERDREWLVLLMRDGCSNCEWLEQLSCERASFVWTGPCDDGVREPDLD